MFDLKKDNVIDIVATSLNGVNDSIYIFFSETQTTSIPSEYCNNNVEITLFPNPANKNLTIIHPPSVYIEIYDLQGKLLKSKYTTGEKSILNIQNLRCGSYIINIHNNKLYYTQKIIKQ